MLADKFVVLQDRIDIEHARKFVEPIIPIVSHGNEKLFTDDEINLRETSGTIALRREVEDEVDMSIVRIDF